MFSFVAWLGLFEVVSGFSQYITPAADDQFQFFRLSNPIPINGTRCLEKSSGYKLLESVEIPDISVGQEKSFASYKAIPGIQGSVSLERFDRRFITFNFRGQGNAQLLFQAHETIEDKDVFLVEIGGGEYFDRVAVYDAKLPGGNVLEEIILPDTTSSNEYRSFWISWDKQGSVHVGLCNNPLTDPEILRAEHAVNFPVNHVSISTSSDNEGIWQFASDFEDLGGCQVDNCMGSYKCDVSSSVYTGTCVADPSEGVSYPQSGTCVGDDIKSLMKRAYDTCCGGRCDRGYACHQGTDRCVKYNSCPGGCAPGAICCGRNCHCPWPNVMVSGKCGPCRCDSGETCSIDGDCFCGENKVRYKGNCVMCDPSQDCRDNPCTPPRICCKGNCNCPWPNVVKNGVCQPCNCPGHQVCTNQGNCICGEHRVRHQGRCVSCVEALDCNCPPNELCTTNGNCVCGDNKVRDGGVCVTCTEALACPSCPSPKVCVLDGSTSSCKCPADYHEHHGKCIRTIVCPHCKFPKVCTWGGHRSEDGHHSGHGHHTTATCQCREDYHDDGSGGCVKDIECPDCNFPRVCVVKGSTASCQCRHDYHVNHLGICVKDIVCPICPSPKVCVVDGGTASCRCPEGYHDNGSGGCVNAIVCPTCPHPKVCVVRDSATCECPGMYHDDGWGNCVKDVVCPTCVSPKVCVVDGSTASCQCPKGYLDNSSGGCVMALGCPSCPSPKVCVFDGSTAQCRCPEGYHEHHGTCINAIVCPHCTHPKVCVVHGHGHHGHQSSCECPHDYHEDPSGACVHTTTVCPDCSYPKVCVVDGSSASCQCRQNYHDDSSGGCVQDIACPTCIDPKVCVVDGSTASCQCPKYYHDDVFGGCTRSIVCPNCAHPKVCVVDGSSATCKCPEDYHEDNFGGCVHAIVCPTCIGEKVCYLLGDTPTCDCPPGFAINFHGTCSPAHVCPYCAHGKVCIHHSHSNTTCGCPSGYIENALGVCQAVPACPNCPGELVCLVDDDTASCQCPSGLIEKEPGKCRPPIECPICADGKICVVDDDGEAVCACPAGSRLNMMGTCSKCPDSCMTSDDCANFGEMCSNGVCECLRGEKLQPGRCIAAGQIGGQCLNGMCFGRRVGCDIRTNMCTCDNTCLPEPQLLCIPLRVGKF